MRRAEIVTAVLMAALSIYFMWKSAELPIGWIPDEGPGGGAFSFWLSAMMLVCCVVVAINWARRASGPSQSTEPFMDSFAFKRFLLVGGGVTGLIGLVYFISMYGAIFVFMTYYLRILGRHSWLTTLSISISTPIVTFFFFDVALRIVLPKGYAEPLFLPLYDIFL